VSRRRWRDLAGPLAGAAVVTTALAPPLHGFADTLFAGHMVQHLLLIASAAPLLSLGRPGLVLLGWLPRPARRWLTAQRHRVAQAMRHRAGIAVAAWLLHVAVLWAWHAPALYDLAARHPLVHAVEHASLLSTAWAFWAVLLHPGRGRRTLGAADSLLYLFAAAGQCAALGALLTLAESPWYTTHAETAGAWGLTPLEDQQLAGVLMWLAGGLVYVAIALTRLATTLNAGRARPARTAPGVAIAIAVSVALTACGPTSAPDRVVSGGDPARGRRAVTAYGCGACHVVPGVREARGRVGPSLAGLAERPYLAGRLVNNEPNLLAWVRHPREIDPQTLMPDLAVTEADARDIAALLLHSRAPGGFP
jgi:putative membrane protein